MRGEVAVDGRVRDLIVGRVKGSRLESVKSVTVRAGRGIEGDRYFRETPNTDASRDLTLIEHETLQNLLDHHQLSLDGRDLRRNVVTQGVALRSLLGKRFSIGSVRCIGIEECPPCIRLEELTSVRLGRVLRNRGGLRAAIISDGRIEIGDRICS